MNLLSILLFTFALLTDTHISTGNQNNTEDLQRSIASINQNPAIEFVVVTGDLTESGDRASIELIKSELDKLRVPSMLPQATMRPHGRSRALWISHASSAIAALLLHTRAPIL